MNRIAKATGLPVERSALFFDRSRRISTLKVHILQYLVGRADVRRQIAEIFRTGTIAHELLMQADLLSLGRQ